ncbi:MAG: hypothetical protein AB7G13_00785 [Lautropia sp.]
METRNVDRPYWMSFRALIIAISAGWTSTCVAIWLIVALATMIWPAGIPLAGRWAPAAYLGGLVILIGAAGACRAIANHGRRADHGRTVSSPHAGPPFHSDKRPHES